MQLFCGEIRFDMGLENILPTYHRSPTKLPISLNKLCRSKERVLLGFVCFGLVIACFGTVFFQLLKWIKRAKNIYYQDLG